MVGLVSHIFFFRSSMVGRHGRLGNRELVHTAQLAPTPLGNAYKSSCFMIGLVHFCVSFYISWSFYLPVLSSFLASSFGFIAGCITQ